MSNPAVMDIILKAENLRKTYTFGSGQIEVLKGIDFEVGKGDFVAIMGASGSGKTTLLQILGTLDRPDSGKAYFKGRELFELSDDELSKHRNRNIGFLFQFHNLLPEFSALENVMMPGLISGGSAEHFKPRAVELLARVGLEKRLNHRSGELSGGEQQRVALARALIMGPALLFADEPTGNLDSRSGRAVFELLAEMNRAMSLTSIIVTHNLELAREADRCLTLRDGLLFNS